MSSIDVLENKISAIKKYLKILQGYKKFKAEKIKQDVYIRGGLERYLYLVSQSAIDLAEGVIAYQKLRKPSTMAECFDILYENKIISKTMVDKMTKMTGFRNIVAHDYEDIDYDIVYNVLMYKLIDIERFANIINKKIIV